MEFLDVFNRIMEQQEELALATCIEESPNVRVVNFYYDKAHKGVVYFSTFGDNNKVQEFYKNNKVAFTTLPHEGTEHVRVKNGSVQKSQLTIYDVKDKFIEKIPSYAVTIEQAGMYLELFEIHFKEAEVTIDFEQSGKVTFEDK